MALWMAWMASAQAKCHGILAGPECCTPQVGWNGGGDGWRFEIPWQWGIVPFDFFFGHVMGIT